MNKWYKVIKRRSLALMAVIGILSSLVAGCATDECYDNRNALPYAGFYGVLDGKMTSITVESLKIYGLGAPGDSVLSDGSKTTSNVYLPFRIDSDTTSYVFQLGDSETTGYTVNDTVTFIYSREVRFVSSACGASYVFGIKDIRNSGEFIDSIVVPEGKITNADMENIKIYFNTGEEI